jgi:hypothetical protein
LRSAVIEDTWVQVCFLLFVISAILSVHYFWLQPVVASGLAPTAMPTAAPRTAGRWVVDPRRGPGADCASLGEALAGARDGDVIELRPGVYDESARISKSVTIVGGGSSPDQVSFSCAGTQTLQIDAGRVVLENMRLSNAGHEGHWAITLAKARLSLRKVKVLSAAGGVRVLDADLDVSDSELGGSIALAVSGESRANIVHATLTGEGAAAVAAEGGGVYLNMEDSSIRNSHGSGLEARRSARVRLRDVVLSGNFSAAVAVRSGAEVRISRSRIEDNRQCAVSVDDGLIALEQVSISRDRCGVEFLGPGTLEAWNSRFLNLPLGAVSVKPGLGDRVVIRHSGNIGLPEPKARKASND